MTMSSRTRQSTYFVFCSYLSSLFVSLLVSSLFQTSWSHPFLIYPSPLIPLPAPPEMPSLPSTVTDGGYHTYTTSAIINHGPSPDNSIYHSSGLPSKAVGYVTYNVPPPPPPPPLPSPLPLMSSDVPHVGESVSQSSECAIVLKRTLVRKSGESLTAKSPAPTFHDLMKTPVGGRNYYHYDVVGPPQEVCIRYMDVNRAIQAAKHRRGWSGRPPGLDSLEPPVSTIGEAGELTLEVTKILATQFKLSPDEILNGLPLLDMSRTFLWDACPAHVKPIPCTIERYRTFTGHCNNLKNPSWGASFTPFVRYLPPVYANGIDEPRVSVVDGSPLPSPRLITAAVHRDNDHPQGEMSILVMSWGQFIDHDLTLAAPPRDDQGNDFNCCDMEPGRPQHPNCFTIDIPRNDYFYSRFGRTCMDFKRSVAGVRPHCALGPRVHVNTLTSAIDANFVYGSDEALARKLRSFNGGQMRVWDRFRDYNLKPLLPPESDNPERDCTARPRHLFCFIAGDERVNEQIHLTVLHTLYVRDHNRMAREMALINPHWDDERIYQEIRHIMAASVQHITMHEFLPLLIGEEMVRRYNLTESEGYWDGYDPTVHIGPAHGFQTAAFRFGHTFIQSMVRRYNKWHEFIGEDPLRNLLRQPFILYEPGKMDELIGGLINTPAQTYDPFISGEVGNHLFEQPRDGFGLDLPAINLQRGREHGVPGYNVWREWCGLPRVETFEELEPYLQNRTAFFYKQLYKHPDDIDLWSGGISEFRLPGALIGPTFACIIARQFANIRRGDRFWFENSGFPSAFTPEQLGEIRKTTQAKIICQNSDDMPTIQRWVLKMPHSVTNPRVPCHELPSIDLRYWKEDPHAGGFSYGNNHIKSRRKKK